ncbi:large ribosomal subunit protein bL35m-like [Physella acuta]|uniref:large ribosomal subunit protein bL35m-like n=1 Tax=Physella acuta TaxID=109671 RepID=UPI0027DDC671|nr:large ribosomal subunit protein bL35m-like [Physella acuta]
MAASLFSLMSRVVFRSQKALPSLISPKQFSAADASLVSAHKRVPPFNTETSSVSLCHVLLRAFHSTPVRPVTVELRQWREHRVINRFYRLHWGGWIRCYGGRFKQLYKKSAKEQWRLKQHIFVTRNQSRKLDVLVTAKWREPKYFPDSPYDPYHTRTNSYHFPNHRKFYP